MKANSANENCALLGYCATGQFLADVPELPTGPIFRRQDETDRVSRNVGK